MTKEPEMSRSPDHAQAAQHAADVLARTLYGEARGESVRGKEAVAAVVMNRVRRARAAGSRKSVV